MPSKEIKELRQSGKLDEALEMAKGELSADPNNIWPKRNISWVYYEYLKLTATAERSDDFLYWINELKSLNLPPEEVLLFDNLSWQIAKLVFSLNKQKSQDISVGLNLLSSIKDFHFTRPSEPFSVLFKAFHSYFKETNEYIFFSDWWNLQNLMPKDFQSERTQEGKEMMSLAEQAYITYARKLLPVTSYYGELIFDKDKVLTFIPILSDIVERYPEFQYPAYFNAKLLLALGDRDNVLDIYLPFARKKRNIFWVWELLADVLSNDPDKVFSCYCRALSCKSPEEMLVKLRQKMASMFISRGLYNEAKTEIERLIKSREIKEFKIPNEVISWQSQEWYKTAKSTKNNLHFYDLHLQDAEMLLFSDIPEETVIVDYIQHDKKILNFLSSETHFGFFNYHKFFDRLKIGDTLQVRFQGGTVGGIYHPYTARISNNPVFRAQFIKQFSGKVIMPVSKSFAFVDDVYIHPTIVKQLNLLGDMEISGQAIKTYNREKKQWTWKYFVA
ncbi:MAG: hypothetical protein K9I82_15560 [Chitinophagaceae bacterium]|nr:hypothetical protein [Chitinophagaceae bacterium]